MANDKLRTKATAVRFLGILLLATTLCFCAAGCSAGSSQAAGSGSATSSQASASGSAASSQAASAGIASSQAASAAADSPEIDLSDPTLLTDWDEFKFETVKVYTPKKFQLDVDPEANVAENEMWRVSPYISFLISRKPLSDYAEIAAEYDAEQHVKGLLEDEEAFQQFIFESVASRYADTVTDNINGRWYQCFTQGDKAYFVWTVLIDDENSYWINFLCPLEEKDSYHDLMVQLIGKAEIDRS